MDHQFGVADKVQKCLTDGRELGFVAQEIVTQPVHLKCLVRHPAFGVDVLVIGFSRRHMPHQLDRANLDDTIAAERVKAGGFGVQNDLTHGVSLP